MDNNVKALFGKKQMKEVQRQLKELEKGTPGVVRKDDTIILPYNVYLQVTNWNGM